MKVALKLEAIGDCYIQAVRDFDRMMTDFGIASRHDDGPKLTGPWVARVSYLGNGRFDRVFQVAKKDYTNANSKGSRGVEMWYFLDPGVYEIFERISWKRSRRYFAVCDGACIREVEKQEALNVLVSEATTRHQRP